MCGQFFDVPEGTSLANHLDKLSAKYPRSEFDEKMLDWLDVVDLSMGKPELAKVRFLPPRSSSAAARLRFGRRC